MTSATTVQVKLFAIFRDMLGKTEIAADFTAGETVGDLFARLLGERAAPALRDATMFAVNEEYVSADTVLKSDDRVAFIPPVSGG